MSRLLCAINIVLVLLGLWLSHDTLAQAQETQGVRVFDDVCEGCVVSSLTGFSIFPEDCTCFYTCLFAGTVKLSSMASQYVAYKRCCPCGSSFSMSRLSCVPYNSKFSECFENIEINPCSNAVDGERVPRSDPFDASPNAQQCAGFNTCENLLGTVVPNPTCCPMGTCFDNQTSSCTAAACRNSESCSKLTRKKIDTNCNCEPTEAPKSECFFTKVQDSITQFMGVQHMVKYTCPAGMCWDQSLCSCVDADNTVNTQCLELLDIDFSGGSFDPVTGLGHEVWAINNGAELTPDGAFFTNGAFINIAGLAGIHLGNTAVFHIRFTPSDSPAGLIQCLLGNCLTDGFSDDTILVNFELDITRSVLSLIGYQDRSMNRQSAIFISVVDPVLMVNRTVDLWLIFCGEGTRGEAAFGIFENDTAVLTRKVDVFDVDTILTRQSGFLLGKCGFGGPFEGTISLVEFYNCKPLDKPEFVAAANALDLDL